MSNFAETLAYWYLRLNGFFPLVDFVHHEAGAQHGDTDIIAVRLPNVVERIGSEKVCCDKERLEAFGVNLTTDIIGVIAEVKGGHDARPSKISNERLRRAVERLGIFDDSQAPRVIRDLENGPISRVSSNSVAIKVLFYRDGSLGRRITGWHDVSLSDAQRFITCRLRAHTLKQEAWHLFPDDLMQFLTWKAREDRARASGIE